MNYDFSYKRTNYDLSRERNKHEVRFAKCCRGSAGAGRSFNRAPEQDARSGCILSEVAQALDPATHHVLMQQIARGLSALKQKFTSFTSTCRKTGAGSRPAWPN